MQKRQLFALYLFFFLGTSLKTQAQVFNQGAQQVAYQNLLKYGITFMKTDDSLFDQSMISALENNWTISEFKVNERLQKPDKKSTALFVRKKKITKQYFQDRKNQYVLMLLPGALYEHKGDVNMERTLGYMYYNGFYPLMKDTSRYLFNHMMIGSLNAGLKWIKEKKLLDVGTQLNTSISETIIEESGNPLGNTLLISREQAQDYIDMEKIEDAGIRYRLVAHEEYLDVIRKRDKQHYVLYFAQNQFTEISLVSLESGKIIYTKHFLKEYPMLKKAEIKAIALYFK
ncbi:MAG: hypothetical protein MI810_06380 [Flavobacteriales bacterium]|jgi:hypothetical protein|nr:hypothetical protein [Flavobacteriales bacterium]